MYVLNVTCCYVRVYMVSFLSLLSVSVKDVSATMRGTFCKFCVYLKNGKIFLLIYVKMPTIVGILTFTSRKNSILGLSEPENSWIS